MIREDTARKLCEQLGDKWEELSDSSKGWLLSKEELLEEADQIINLIVDKLTVIGDDEILAELRKLTDDEWIETMKRFPEFTREAQLQHTIKEIKEGQ